MKLWQWLNQLLHGYVVQVYWEGDWYVHESRTAKDAIEWAKQYPQSACHAIINLGNDEIVQWRGFVLDNSVSGKRMLVVA